MEEEKTALFRMNMEEFDARAARRLITLFERASG